MGKFARIPMKNVWTNSAGPDQTANQGLHCLYIFHLQIIILFIVGHTLTGLSGKGETNLMLAVNI